MTKKRITAPILKPTDDHKIATYFWPYLSTNTSAIVNNINVISNHCLMSNQAK